MPNGYLPPVVATLGGSAADFIAKLREAKALLEQWGRSEAKATLGLETAGAIAKFRALSAALSREGITVPLKLHYESVGWAREAAQMSIADAIRASAIPTRDLRAGGGALGATAASGAGGAAGGLLRTLLWGGGANGLPGRWGRMLGFGAGMGSVASFAGLGPEHLLMTLTGLAGSAAGAGIGGGLLGLGAGGVTGVGMLTDAGGIGQAAGDTKNVVQAQNALAQAIAVYGASSAQAKDAQAQLNYTLASFSPVAKQAVLAAANTAQGFRTMYDQVTGTAEKLGAQIITQAMQVGEKFLPTLGQYAAKNMGIIQSSLQPLFDWLGQSGDNGGLGIFTNLEQIFSSRLPTAMQAFDQGIELLLRTINLVAPQTGGMVAALAKMTTHFNGAGWSTWASGVNHLIGLFREWEALIKIAVADIYQLFHADAGTASGIVQSLTAMLTKLHDWEASAQGQSAMNSVFETHKQQVLALLQILPDLVKGFGSVYLTVAPAMTAALALVLQAIVPVLNAFTSNPFGAWVVGLGLIAGKLGLLSGLFRNIVPMLGRATASFLGLGASGNVLAEGEVAASVGARALQIALGVGVLGVVIAVGLGIYELIKHFGVLPGLLIVGATAVGGLTVAMWALDAVPIVALIVGIVLAIVGLIAGIVLLVTHWKQVWSDIKQWASDAWHAIDSDVIQPMGRFFTGTIPQWVSDAGTFFSRMWHDVAGFFKNMWSDVTGGILSWWNTTETWFVNLPGNIITAIGDVTKVLYDVGAKIIQGLWDGMKHVWKDVSSWLSGLGKKITNLKGPPSTDAVLLIGNGQLIMRGLGVGLEQGYATHVAPVLSAVAGQINGRVRAGIGAGMTPLGSVGASTDQTRILSQILAELQAQTRNGNEQLKVNKGQLDRLAAIPPTVARAVRGGQTQLVTGLRGGSLR